MKRKKAILKIAIILLVALIIIGVCLCLLFDYNPFRREADPELTPEPETVTAAPTPAAATPEPTETPARKPSADDLKGSSDSLYHPKPENYLPEYQNMLTRAEKGDTVYVQYRPEKREYSRDVIIELDNNTPVTAIAKENGYTLVLVKEGLAGWVPTQDLESN